MSELLQAVGSYLSAENTADKNIEMQKQFAKQGIRWKVADAQAAGIHPLYALGAQTHSFAPISTGGDLGSLAGGLAADGQNIASAIDATRTAPEKVDAYTASLRQLQLEKGGLENELLRSQISGMRQAGQAPPMPSATDPYLMTGQTNSGLKINEKPLSRVTAQPGMPWSEPGAVPGAGWERTATGLAPVPSKDVKERIEDSPMEWMWFLRNNLIPSTSREGAALRAPPRSALPRGATDWWFNPLVQEYQPVYPRYREGDG